MNEIEQQAVQTYQKNLQYLEENHKELYEKISLLNVAIEDGSYLEKYTLEYKDEGYFDIKELASQEYLYKINSNVHATSIKNLIDKKRSGGLFKALKRAQATDALAEIIDKSELSFHNYLWASIKIINYTAKYAPLDSYMKKVYKAIFIGIGLGIHIKDIIKKLQAQIIFLQEKNLEIFRLSLFVTNYAELSEDCTLYFSILEKPESEQKIFLDFLNHGNNYNLYIKHIPFDDLYKSELQQFQTYVLSQNHINYGYSPLLLRYIDSPKYLVDNYNFLNVTKRQNNDIFTEKPVLLLFSGPSTSNNIDWIKKNHQKFIIISALSTCKLLNKIGISPDIVVHIDPGKKTALLFEGIDTEKFFKNTQVVLAANVDENTISRFEKSQVHIIEQGSKYKKGFGLLTAPSVGEYSYALSLIFASKNIYMLGIDLALDSETLMSHADFHQDQAKGVENHDTASLDPAISMSYIKGNLQERIPTTPAYKISIEQLNYFSQYYKSDTQNVFNLSNGAYFNGVQPLYIDEYDWNQFTDIDKTALPDSLNKLFRDIGSAEFREEDREALLYQIAEAKKLKKQILKHQKTKYNDVSKYFNALATLYWELGDIENKTNSDLAQVLYEYFQTVQSYIYDLFNTQNLENPKTHIIEIDKILVKQLLKITNTYIDGMQRYLK